jgi:hypothetical protein
VICFAVNQPGPNLCFAMPEDDRAVTMQKIADEAGVSRMAVSLALRNSPKISAETRERIQESPGGWIIVRTRWSAP